MEYVILYVARNLFALSSEVLQVLFYVLIIEIDGVEDELDESDLSFKYFDCLLAAELGVLDSIHADSISLLLIETGDDAHDDSDGGDEAISILQIVQSLQQVE